MTIDHEDDVGPVPVFSGPVPHIRPVPVDRPWHWLQLGMADLGAAWRVSLTYGALIAGFSLALTLLVIGSGHVMLMLPLTSGFTLVAPLIAVGLYATSRDLGKGRVPDLRRALRAWAVNPLQVGFLGVLLLLLHLFWVRVATLMYALFFADLSPTLDGLTATLFHSGASLPFLIAGTLIGAGFAGVAFAVSVVSIPMLLDRRTNAFTAMATSIMAVRVNLPAMALWAFIIVFLTAIGIATLFVGLIVTLPLIGHASWHAYKDLVTEG
ncbi:DUF2189 domain-containing protein [Niveispirillum sp.]|uniref:DUF2189 domain-containing protein n=1 Tax=Niveispirillum sp. TaxID=1917217 RepID=UPI001B750649|nr:DUF2189 domain-containing protein [Niveispirillum sp.]MBP7334495.1 DUF2189 domain-containing protein [Niveispirillum sp.]